MLVGRFDIEKPARSGGMGTVYRAHDRESGQTVALKLLPEATDDAERFLREAEVLAALEHPAIVRYLSHGRIPGGGAWLAMEWLDGEDLGERLRREGLTVDESVRLLRRVAAGLAQAHARGVVHRDIKPANVFLPGGDVEQAKLLDFGVARQSGPRTRLTQTGMILGTPAYMAPEQVRGARDVDARADVFSLGCLLYECLSGRPAFLGEHLLGVLARVLFEEAPRLMEARPDAPAALDDLVARMIAKDPALRPADAAAVLAELAALGPVAGGPAPRGPERVALSAAERRVVSVVFAGGAGDRPADNLAAQIDVVARRFGAHIERVTGGTLAAALSGNGPATDQAADAARLALALRTLLPDAPIALATGHGLVAGALPAGDAIDRAAKLLELRGAHIFLDSVSAALLEGRFELAASPQGLVLVGARDGGAPPRTLLGRPTPCVGREHELALLDAVYAEVVAEPAARVVLVSAASGAGKSRLRHEWLRRLAERRDPGLVLVCRGDPMSAGAPFVLAGQAVRRAAGINAGEAVETQRARLAEHAGWLGVRPQAAAFLGELLGLGGEAGAEPLLLGDQMRWAWQDWLAALCARRPVVLVLEDLHWGDAPSVKLVDAALGHLREQPLFVLALARRDVQELFPRLWEERGLQEVRLADLPRRAAAKLVEQVLGDRATPEKASWIVERAGGNALYLEELIRAVSDRDAGDAALPESVLAMVQARLAGLPADARRLLRAASVFGESFWRGGVAALVGAELRPELFEELTRREVVSKRRESRFPGEHEFTFRHALFREAAYGMLTDADRTLGHRLAAGWLLAAGERQPLVLAEHFERGGLGAEAVPWYARAAEEALEGNDFTGSVERASRGIVCGARGEELGRLRLLQASAHNWRGEHQEADWCAAQAIELLPPRSAGWYDALRETLDAALPAPRDKLERVAGLLAEPPADAAARPAFARTAATCVHHRLYHGDRAGAEALLARLDGFPGDPWLERMRASIHDFAGAPDAARAAYQRAAAAFELSGNLRQACAIQINVGWLEATELGLHVQAEERLRAALATARRMGLGRTIPAAEQNLGVALMRQGRLDEARSLLDGTVAEFLRQHDTRMEAGSRFYLTLLHALAGDVARAEAAGRRAVELASAVPTTRACSLAALSRALLLAGRQAEALECARQAQAILDDLGGIEEGEALIRLALIEALLAGGGDAGPAIAVAAARLEARAARIADPEIRRSFLESVPENARTRELSC